MIYKNSSMMRNNIRLSSGISVWRYDTSTLEPATSRGSIVSINSVDIKDSVDHVGEYTDSYSFKYLFCQLPFAHIIPLIFPNFYLVRFAVSSAFFLYSLLNSSLISGPKTGFPCIGPSFNFSQFLSIAETARSPNCLIPFFDDIFVNIT